MVKRPCLGPAPGRRCPAGRLVDAKPYSHQGSRCVDCKRAHQRTRDQARAGDPVRVFRRSQAWIKTSRAFRAAHPAVCVLCGATERLTVGHITPLAKCLGTGLELDWANLRVECTPCQNRQGHQQS